MLAPVFLFAAGLLAGDATSAHLANARRAIEAHDFAKARAELHLAVAANPRSVDAWMMLGGAEFQAGDVAAAVQGYQRALQLAPSSFAGHYNLALAYLRQSRQVEGRRELERALAIDARQPDAAYNLGLVLLQLNEPRLAVRRLEQARDLQPGRSDVAFHLIRARLAAKDIKGATEEAGRASTGLSQDGQWQLSVGQLFLDSGYAAQAVPRLEAAMRLQPGADEPRRLLAAAYTGAGNPERTLKLIPEPKDAEEHILRAEAFRARRELTEAAEESARAVELEPGNPSYLLTAARIQQSGGHYESALEILRRALERAPRHAEVHYNMAVSYYFLRRYEDARRSLGEALKSDPQSPRSLFLYGITLINQGESRPAEKCLRQAIALEPDNARYRFHLGTALLRDNRPAEAQTMFEKAVRLKPDYALPHYELGKLMAACGRHQAALREFEKAVQFDPGLDKAYYQLSLTAGQLGQSEKAAQALATFKKLKKLPAAEDQEASEDLSRELTND